MMPIDPKNQEVLITRYLTGEASHDEIVELQVWLVASKDNLLYFQQLKISGIILNIISVKI